MNDAKPPAMIAVDGPAASGKTTLGRMLADFLGYLFLDTGSMYRALTLAVLQAGVDPGDEAAVAALAQAVDIVVTQPGAAQDDRLYTVMLDGSDVTWAIRTPEVDRNVSQVSAYAGVRQEMVRRQREIGRTGRVVMVGRDIGTVVLPDAPLKLYVIASVEERARRRWRERLGRGEKADYDQILADMIRRDRFDGTRAHSPMVSAADAHIIDTTHVNPAELFDQIVLDFITGAPADDA